VPRTLELSGKASGLRLLLSDTLHATACTLILADPLAYVRLPLARLQALALLLSTLEPKQLALLRTIQPPAALLRRL
jgi:hypothetical protein